ncbi:MAG: beta-glucosidase H [Acidimicrobiales bacterium]
MSRTPAQLAQEVLAKMSLSQKASFVVLNAADHGLIENTNVAIPTLCIPALTLVDGTSGVAANASNVTQLPAELAIGATFDTSLAYSVGQVQGAESRVKGFSVVQGPDLNLARVPLGGRNFETYGEDPFLAGAMGAADISGIQSNGVLALAKHLGPYTQETARPGLNQLVSPAALAELYNPPFQAAVQQGHVAGIMCSYGLINGVNSCQDPSLYAALASWGFVGIVRSDYQSVIDPASALGAGMAMIKPYNADQVISLVRQREMSKVTLNHAVATVLATMFAGGLITQPITGSPSAPATNLGHVVTALQGAEESVVLMKNANNALPLDSAVASVAVIGADASTSPSTVGGGSSKVNATSVSTPLAALRSVLGAATTVTYQPGVPATDLTTVSPVTVEASPPAPGPDGYQAYAPGSNVTGPVATATSPLSGAGWEQWSTTFTAPSSGTYLLTFEQNGDAWVSLNGQLVASQAGVQLSAAPLSATLSLSAGQPYTVSATWFQATGSATPSYALQDITASLADAAASAAAAKVAVVFVGDAQTEGNDRPSLNLPGAADALIAAVAAANPDTVVVLNTDGAVLMPWLSSVAAVLEAWYPGQVDGTAIAAILTGGVNPSGHLPISFPASAAATPISGPAQFPGVNAVVDLGAGPAALDVGYRWYQANAVAPLFAFGFGLSYTSFALSDLVVASSPDATSITVSVTNTGSRFGSDVVQAYLSYPASAQQPPDALKAFARVSLAPGATQEVVLSIPAARFASYQGSSMTIVAGTYQIGVGDSSDNLPLRVNVQASGV